MWQQTRSWRWPFKFPSWDRFIGKLCGYNDVKDSLSCDCKHCEPHTLSMQTIDKPTNEIKPFTDQLQQTTSSMPEKKRIQMNKDHHTHTHAKIKAK